MIPRSRNILRALSKPWLIRFACGLIIVVLCSDKSLHADETTGTWSGEVEARGNYYWERSTRVVAPEVGILIESPSGIRARGHYLVDSITSASVAAGTLVDVGFTEIRHDVTLGIGSTFAIGDNTLDVDLSGRVSTEPDYFSTSGTLSGTYLFNDNNTSIGGSITVLHDDIDSVLRGAGGMEGVVDDQGNVGSLTSIGASINGSHNLSPTLVLSGGYDFTHLSGYLSNPYRSVSLGGAPVAENHPDARIRHTLHARLAWFVPATDSAFHLLARGYTDSWEIAAINPEVLWYQEIADVMTVRLRYRFYTQTRAFFQKGAYNMADTVFTADGKMAAFTTHLMGAKFVIPMSFLEGGALGFLSKASVDLSFDLALSDSIFGDFVITQTGLRVPFDS